MARLFVSALIGTVLLAVSGPCALAQAPARASFQYFLANEAGVIPYSIARVRIDAVHDESYVIDSDSVRVFNATGMEIYRFGLDARFGMLRDIAILDDGRLLALGIDLQAPQERPEARVVLSLCNYRGRPEKRIVLSGVPADLPSFEPNSLQSVGDKLYLASSNQMLAAVFDRDGAFLQSFDLGQGLEDPSRRASAEAFSFYVDGAGSMYYTIPTEFRVFIMAPDGSLRSFGKAGSGPGMFGVVSGVVVAQDGTIYVTDRLRSVVMAFDRGFKFLGEFDGSATPAGKLIRPTEVAVTRAGNLLVTQVRNVGIAVFKFEKA